MPNTLGYEMHQLAQTLWPLNRSITGDGVRQTLSLLKNHLPALKVFEVQSGTQVLDWKIPPEWRVRDAYIITPAGEKICDFHQNNLHLVGYSIPFSGLLTLDQLQEHLHCLPDQPDAIPYITSYYEERWGFCISDNERKELKEGLYKIVVDSELFEGSLTYGELLIPGETSQEIFMSTYICHPSMANNELSGPVVATFLAKWLLGKPHIRYSYRIIFIPETIGSITYLSQNLTHLKKYVFAGFNISCVGDNRAFSYLPSRHGNTASDKIARHVLKWLDPNFKTYTWRDRGSDERQYCAPQIDLPIASIMRTKYGEYPEYHTSLDNLTDVVSSDGLQGGYDALRLSIEALEKNIFPNITILGEPQLSKRGLYPTLSTKHKENTVKIMMDLITWSDGKNSLLDIAENCGVPIWELYKIVDLLKAQNLLKLEVIPKV